MAMLPLALSLVAAIVVFAGVSYVLNFYRGRYDRVEMNAAFVISGATLLFIATVFYGQYIFRSSAGEFVLGCFLTMIVMLAAVVAHKILKTG
jgi:hypothetical protein